MYEPTHRLKLIEEQIQLTEGVAKQYRNMVLKRMPPDFPEQVRAVETQNGTLAPLPARLPRAVYVLDNGTIERDHSSMLFYLACEDGVMSDITSIVTQREQVLSQATLQYCLELASFACNYTVVRYLLDNGAVLHSSCFMRRIVERENGQHTVCLFDSSNKECANTDDFISLLLSFIQCGSWHPNQAWESPAMYEPAVAMIAPRILGDRKLPEFLLSHGADPNLSKYPKSARDELGRASFASINQRGSRALNYTAAAADRSLFELLLAHGARVNTNDIHSLHSVARKVDKLDFASRRRPFAEYLLNEWQADINEVKAMPWRHDDERLSWDMFTENETPLSRACAASDWEYAEWLIQNGADPDALDGKARSQQWWMKPHTPNDPSQLQEILERHKMNSK